MICFVVMWVLMTRGVSALTADESKARRKDASRKARRSFIASDETIVLVNGLVSYLTV